MSKSNSNSISKEELIKRAKDAGFFKKPKVEVMYARENGHFYYNQPPAFKDGLETFKITRKEVTGKGSEPTSEVEYPLNQKDTVALIKTLENESGVQELIDSGQLLKDDARKGVQAELAKLAKK